MKKMLFIYNPQAGKGQIKSKLSAIIEEFSAADYEITIYPTKRRLDARNIVECKAKKYDLIVCCGGDGTLNEVTSGLMMCENKPEVGYIPAGTVNDFATSLHIPKDPKKAADAILNGIPFACDIGSMDEDYFMYVAGFGAFTEVSYETSQDFKNVLGKIAYFLEGVKRLPTIKPYHVSVSYQDQVIEDDFIFGMVTNSKSVGGFRGITGKEVYLDDGLFDVMLIKVPKNPIELQTIVNSLLMKNADTRYIYQFHASLISFHAAEPIPWVKDGESGGIRQDVIIRNHKQAIQFMVENMHPNLEDTKIKKQEENS